MDTRPQVFFYEAFQEEAEELRAHLPGEVEAGFTADTIQEHGNAVPPARVISIRTQSVIPASWSGSLSAILSRSTGYDHVAAYRRATGTDAQCGYLPLYCSRAVAEQAMLLWSALLRRLPTQVAQFRQFHRDGLTGREIEGRTLAVVGVGNIGREVVRIGEGLGMHVRGVDLVRRHPSVNYVGIDEALQWADVIVCAMNLTGQNRAFFDYDRLRVVNPGAVLVNIARGELCVPGDLLRLLREGILGGIGMDVYDDEPALAIALRTGKESSSASARVVHELAQLPNVICTPHNAFNTVESVTRKSAQSVEQLQAFWNHGEFLWPVP